MPEGIPHPFRPEYSWRGGVRNDRPWCGDSFITPPTRGGRVIRNNRYFQTVTSRSAEKEYLQKKTLTAWHAFKFFISQPA